MNKILFISHDASRTGAPLLLLDLLKWIKENTQLEFDLLLLNGGELESEFEKLSRVYRPKPISVKLKLFQRLLKKLNVSGKEHQNTSLNHLQITKYSVIYGNTIVSISVFEQLFKKNSKAFYFLHIHELYSITKAFENTIERTKGIPIKYIAVSEVVRKNLIDKHKIGSKISLIYGYINIGILRPHIAGNISYTQNKFIVNGSGLVHPRKGYDIFIIIAQRALKKYNNIPFCFKWIGEIPPNLKPYIEIDIENSGLNNYIEFTGSIKQPFPYYASADIFLLTSREDPFPLVCLEHACLGIPTICFEFATGITEFVGKDCGIIIPYLDIEKAADALADMYFDTVKRKELGMNAQRKVQQYDINLQIPKILDVINNA